MAMEPGVEKMKAVKSGSTFLLCDERDELPCDPDSPGGIYRNDMRLVRAYTVAAESDAAIIKSKSSVFYDGNLYHKIEFATESDELIRLAVNFIPGCDDIFDVRNSDIRSLPHSEKPFRGKIVSSVHTENGMSVFAVGDTTGANYKTGFQSSWAGTWHGDVFEISASLQKEKDNVLYLAAGDETTRLPGTLAEQFEEAVRHAKSNKEKLRSFGLYLVSENLLMNEALQQAQEDLSVMITDLETGPYPYAGLPWYSCPFGRDALVTTLLLIDNYPALAKGVLAFQAKHQATEKDDFRQAEPGKIFHEMRFGETSAAGKNPFACYYGGVDTTPLFVMVASEYYKRTQDKNFIQSIWPNIEQALSWVEENIKNNNGFLRYHYDKNGLTQQCWKDSADSIFSMEDWQQLARDPIATCEVQAYAYEALKAGETFAVMMEKHDKAGNYAQLAEDLYNRFNEKFWMEEKECYAMALDGDDRQCAVISSNAGHCLLSDIVPEDRAKRTAQRLMQKDSFSGYGIRTLAEGLGYDPLSYHRGSVWPHDTAMVAMGMRKHGFHEFSNRLGEGLLEVYRHMKKIPELFSGDAQDETQEIGPRPYPAACIIQTWAAAAFVSLEAGKPLPDTSPSPL